MALLARRVLTTWVMPEAKAEHLVYLTGLPQAEEVGPSALPAL